MKQYYPITVRPIGNTKINQNLRAFGKVQMNILENQMSFQGLSQGARRVSLPDGSFILCRKCFNIKIVDIYYPTIINPVETVQPIQYEVQYLSIIFGSPEERIIFQYAEDVKLFFPEDGDAVFCSDEGSGLYTHITDTKMYGQFVKCFAGTVTAESNKATATVIECKENVYENSYDLRELFLRNVADTRPNLISNIFQTSAYDVYPITNVNCQGNPTIENTWSKTYDDMIITAYSYLPLEDDSFIWKVSVSYKDRVLVWGLNGDTSSKLFSRQTCIGSSCLTKRKSHIGFDVWAITNDEGIKEYYVGLIGEQEAILYQWKYIPENSYLELDWSMSIDKTLDESSPWYLEFEPIGALDKLKRLVRLVGYGFDEVNKNHLIYWAMFANDKYYAEDSITVTKKVTTTYNTQNDSLSNPMIIKNAFWNPVKKKPLFIWETQNEELIDSAGYVDTSILIENYRVTSQGNFICFACSNDSTTIDYSYLGVPLQITMPTIINDLENYPPGTAFSYFAQSYTYLHAGNLYDRGSYVFTQPNNSLILSKGQHLAATFAKATLRSYYNGNTEEIANFVMSTEAFGNSCIPYGMTDYSFISGVFTPDDFIFKYSSTPYIRDAFNADDWLCIPSNKEYIFTGKNESLYPALSSTFPYDDTWRSILLHGYCRDNNDVTIAEIEIQGSVVYLNQDENNLFLIDQFGTKHDLDVENNYQRAFFKQQHISKEIEI